MTTLKGFEALKLQIYFRSPDIASIRVHQYDPDRDPNAAKGIITQAIVNSLNELNLQQHLAVKRAANSLDYPSWRVLLELKGTEGLQHPTTRSMGQALGAISRASAISKLLEIGAIKADLTKVTPQFLKTEAQDPPEKLVNYRITSLGTALTSYALETMFTPEVIPILEEQYQKELGEGDPS